MVPERVRADLPCNSKINVVYRHNDAAGTHGLTMDVQAGKPRLSKIYDYWQHGESEQLVIALLSPGQNVLFS